MEEGEKDGVGIPVEDRDRAWARAGKNDLNKKVVECIGH